MDWGHALKVGGPATVAAFVFYKLVSSYLVESKIIETSLVINVVLLVFIFLFCLVFAWLLTPRKKNSDDSSVNKIVDNEIEDNASGSDINVGKKSIIVRGNKIKNNKSDGDINIG